MWAAGRKPPELNRWKIDWGTVVALGFLASIAVFWAITPTVERISGFCLGRPYQITVSMYRWQSTDSLVQAIRASNDRIEMALFDDLPLSEVSRFNNGVLNEMVVSPFLNRLILDAIRFNRETDGVFDITLKPLMTVWGIGTEGAFQPSQDDVRSVLPVVGMSRIHLVDGRLSRDKSGVQISFSDIYDGIIAKEMRAIVHRLGYSRYLIEVGDVVVAGRPRADRELWELGIGIPVIGADPERRLGILSIRETTYSVCVKDKRSLAVGETRFSSVFDGRRLAPVTSDCLVAVVFGDDPVTAQVWSRVRAAGYPVRGNRKELWAQKTVSGDVVTQALDSATMFKPEPGVLVDSAR